MAVLLLAYDGLDLWSVHDDFYRHKDLTTNEIYNFNYYFTKFSRIATNRFKWEFAENEYKKFNEIIENYLWYNGHCIIFKHPLIGWMVTDCVIRSYDSNNRPNKFSPKYDVNHYEISDYRPVLSRYNMDGEFTNNHCIFISDTKNYKNRSRFCIPLIYDIVDTKQAIRTQIFNQNAPLIAVASNEKDKIQCKNLIVGMGKNQKVYVFDDDITKNLKTLDLNSPFNIEPMVNYIHEIENEILEYLALDNTQVFQKKERMITDEVESNNGLLENLYYDCYAPRKYGSDCLNMAGLTNKLKGNSTESEKEVINDDSENEPNKTA